MESAVLGAESQFSALLVDGCFDRQIAAEMSPMRDVMICIPKWRQSNASMMRNNP